MRLEKQKLDYILNISKRGSSKVQKLSIKSLISEELITDLRRKFQSSLNSRRKKKQILQQAYRKSNSIQH